MRIAPLRSIYVFAILSMVFLTAAGCGSMDKYQELTAQGKAMVGEQDFGERSGSDEAGEPGNSGPITSQPANGEGRVERCKKASDAVLRGDRFRLAKKIYPTYEGSVKAMIDSKCAWCHSPAAKRPRTPYLTTFDEVKNEASAVFDAMYGRGEEVMPPRKVQPQLTNEDAQLFYDWWVGGFQKGTPQQPPNLAAGIFYSDDIKVLMANNCIGCHRPGAIAPDLSSFMSVRAGASAALAAMQNGSMPKAGPLSPAQVSGFKAWIDAKTPFSKDDPAGIKAPPAESPPGPVENPPEVNPAAGCSN